MTGVCVFLHYTQDDVATIEEDYDDVQLVGPPLAPTVGSFIASPSTIAAGQTSTLSWSTANATTVMIDNGVGAQQPSGSIVVTPSATTTYTLTANGPGGTKTRQVTITVNPAPTITFTATPASISAGQSSSLSWSTTNTTVVSIDNGIGSRPTTGSISIAPTSTTTYTLTATGSGGTATKQVIVTVTPPAPTITFTATPASVATGQSSTLAWSTTNASTVSIDNGIGMRPTNGSTAVSPTQTTTYTLTATGGGGTTNKQVTVTVNPPPTVAFTATPASISGGQTSTLAWSSTNATSVAIDHGIGTRPLSGSVGVTPSATTTYTVTATGSGGTQSASATVTVNPPPTSTFIANPSTVSAGQSSTLSWTTTNATNVTIDSGLGPQAVNGSIAVSPSVTTTYTLTATGPGGTATKQATVVVSQSPIPTVTFAASPTIVNAVKTTSTLSWTTTSATTVTIDNGLGVQANSGSVSVTPAQTTTFTLTASGPGGTTTKQVTVVFDPTPVIESFSAAPPTIAAGATSALSWKVDTTRPTTVTIENASRSLQGSLDVHPTQTTTYTLTAATNTGESASKQVTVTVNQIAQRPTIVLSATPASISTGQSSTLAWTTTNATTVTIDNGLGAKPPSGSIAVSPATTTTFALTATGLGGTATATVTVAVNEPAVPQITLTAIPATIGDGDTSTLAWTVLNAMTVTLDNGIGPQPLTGSLTVNPHATTTYTLTATGSGGTRTAQVTVTVASIPTVIFTADPASIPVGGVATLHWQVFGASTVILDNGLGPQSAIGSLTVKPTVTTMYLLTATGAGGTRVGQTSVTVGASRRRAARH